MTNAKTNTNNKTFTVEAIAEMDTHNVRNPKTIRKILRANVPAELHPGRGGRWIIAEKDLVTVIDMINSASSKSHSPVDLSALNS